MASNKTYDSNYSTTRLISNDKPETAGKSEDKFTKESKTFETLLFLPEGEGRRGEGGLRTRGSFKKSYDGKPLISVITVVYNGEKYLEETIQSVINQTYDNVEYIIIDGGSTDGTLDIIKRYENQIDYWISETDKGLYDGLYKGFVLSSGQILAYINAGDYYHKCALDVVAEVFLRKNVFWLTGQRVNYNHLSQVIHSDTPSVYRRSFIRSGLYGSSMPYIQQESTFWKRELLDEVDWEYFKSLKLAGDYYLWFSFAKTHSLCIVNSYLGGFKYHDDQLSTSIEAYHKEIKSFVKTFNLLLTPLLIWDMLVWFFPVRLKKKLNRNLFTYDRNMKHWKS